jgi:hypothetical protein
MDGLRASASSCNQMRLEPRRRSTRAGRSRISRPTSVGPPRRHAAFRRRTVRRPPLPNNRRPSRQRRRRLSTSRGLCWTRAPADDDVNYLRSLFFLEDSLAASGPFVCRDNERLGLLVVGHSHLMAVAAILEGRCRMSDRQILAAKQPPPPNNYNNKGNNPEQIYKLR